MERVKSAKAALNLDFRVIPIGVDETTDRRVLAVGTPPTPLVDYFLISETASDAEWQSALSWVLGDHDDWEATTVLDTMVSIFGAGTREISDEELASERRFHDYVNGIA